MDDSRFRKVVRLADSLVAAADPRLRWMWGQALLGYALLELDKALGEDRYLPFLRACCDHWAARDPRVDQSDTAARPHPADRIYWARGNGWVVASLPRILDSLPRDHPERPGILDILARTSAALLPLQRPDGWWDTVLETPGRTYRESGATALIAAGWLGSVAAGYLPDDYRAPAEKAFRSMVDSLAEGPGGRLSIPEISAPTIPLPIFPRLGYALTPRGSNRSYGIAALVLAAVAWKGLGDRAPEDA